MKMALGVLVLLFFASCSTTPTKKYKEVKNDEFSEIESSDFTSVRQVPYRSINDVFKGVAGEHDSLSSESIGRLPISKLRLISDEEGPISKVVSLCYQEEYEKAFAIIDEAYGRYKQHPSYWNAVGNCYFKKGDSRKAYLFYNKASEINPGYAPPINNIGVFYLWENKEQKAFEAFKKAVSLNNSARTPRFNLAQLYLRFGFLDHAKRIFRTLRSYNRDDGDVNSGLAICYLFQGKLDVALRMFESLDNKVLEQPHVGLNYAVALKLSGKLGESHEVFNNIRLQQLGKLEQYYTRVEKFIGL